MRMSETMQLKLKARSRTRQKIVKMEANRSKLKRKSPSTVIFELNDEDLSPENSDTENQEPDSKILKLDDDISESNEPNLENGNENNSAEIIDKKVEECVETVEKTKEEFVLAEETITVEMATPNKAEFEVNSLEIVNSTFAEPNSDPKMAINLEEGEVNDEMDSSRVGLQKTDDAVEVVETNPCICIKFKDSATADIYKQKFLKFVQSFVELHVESSDSTTINVRQDTVLNSSEWVVLDDTICIEDDEELATELPKTTPKKKKNKKKKKGKDLFVVDTNPSEENVKVDLQTKYLTKFSINEKKEQQEPTAKSNFLSSACFNCGDKHNLKDCPLPKNHSKIAAARKEFSGNRNKSSRYHLEEDQKYSHLVPGKVSENLRKALGLKKNQTPPYIYHMRLLGYPPGWLDEAKFVNSNLSLFDIHGNDVEVKTSKNPGLDPSKVIDYPGFNAPFDAGFKDEYKFYEVPPFSKDFGKDKMMEYFQKLEDSNEDNEDDTLDNKELRDMDLDQSSQSVVEVREIKVKQVAELKVIESNLPSPSLNDLEKAKEELLAQLDTNVDSNQKFENETSTPATESEDSQENVSKLSPEPSCGAEMPETPKLHSGTRIKQALNSSFGTPILKSKSPYSRLPNPDNFSKDVSPVINFENLPNSTGKYEQMTDLLQKVRDTLRNQGGKT